MKKIILGLLGILLVGVLTGYGIGWFLQQPQQDTEDIRVVVSEEIPTRGIQLYFTAPEGTFLLPETRDVPICDDDSLCIKNLLNGLINGSQQGNVAILPKETKILGVEIENDLVRVNFSRQLIDFHPGGSLSELLTVYGLINTLNENFSYIRQIQILVDGEIRQTLKGHVRIDQPVYANYSFNQSPLNAVVSTVDSAVEGLSIEKILEDANSAGNN
jgi:hypothetical protein